MERNDLEFNEKMFNTLNLFDGNGKVNNLALLLSDENLFIVKFAVYDENLDFKVKKEFEGCWVWISDQVLEFADLYNITSAKIVSGLSQRIETKSYPDPSLRELITNAFAHFDASRPSNIKIEFFVDRAVITSPGSLFNCNREEIFNGKQSFRNPHLIKILDKVDYIENYAKGIERTINAYKQYGLEPYLTLVRIILQ